MYICYCLIQESVLNGQQGNGRGPSTYVGCTNNFPRRIRQHNCELVGGAKITSRAKKQGAHWVPLVFALGFIDNHEALSFEWHWKKMSQKQKGTATEKRKAALIELLKRPRFLHIFSSETHEVRNTPIENSSVEKCSRV